jgi:transcriptional regulator with XRE-family HTH domain
MIYRDIGLRLKELRGYTSQEKYSKKISVSYRAWQYYESGERLPNYDVLSRIAKISGKTEKWILIGDRKAQNLEEETEAVLKVLRRAARPIRAFIESYMQRLFPSQGPTASSIVNVSTPDDSNSTIINKIVSILRDMSEEDQRDILKDIEKRKLLTELLAERKKQKVHDDMR